MFTHEILTADEIDSFTPEVYQTPGVIYSMRLYHVGLWLKEAVGEKYKELYPQLDSDGNYDGSWSETPVLRYRRGDFSAQVAVSDSHIMTLDDNKRDPVSSPLDKIEGGQRVIGYNITGEDELRKVSFVTHFYKGTVRECEKSGRRTLSTPKGSWLLKYVAMTSDVNE